MLEPLIHHLFEEQVQRTPGGVATVYERDSLTFAELNAKANQLAHYLRERQIGPDKLVGLCVERSLDMVVALLGILKAGGAYVPLDPSYPPERVQYILEDAAPRVLLTQAHLKNRLPTWNTGVITLDEEWSEIARQPSTDPVTSTLGLTPHHLAYVIYTSGSTGKPKGVMIEHRHVLNLWRGLESAYGRSEPCQRIALNASLNFDASVQQWIQLLSGRTLFVIPEKFRRDTSMLLRFFSDGQIHGVDCTPSQLKAWIATGFLAAEASLHLVLVGGEAIDGELWNTLSTCSGPNFYNVYGPTECTVDSTIARLNGDTPPPHIGHPMENRHIYVLDPDQHPTPIGVTGEIYIGGTGIARGYLNRPELTAERFSADPFHTDAQARMYKTGDLGRWRADGNIEYLGRNDSQVKIRGFRIELGEIESQILQHPEVKEAVVLAREDIPGERRLVAYVAFRNPGDATNALRIVTLRAHLRPVLPEYMLPSAFVILESMPLTTNGKLDRRALPSPPSRPEEMGAYVAPRTEIECTLAEIWAQVLRVDAIGMYDTFLDLGGHSLHAMKLIACIDAEFAVDISVVEVLESPTIAQIAQLIESRRVPEAQPTITGEPEYEEGVV